MCILVDIIENILLGKVTVATKPCDYQHKDIWSIRHINTLPRELLLAIFRYLSYSDLKTVVLVCKLWMSVGDEPVLWKHFKLVVAGNSNTANIEDILSQKRFLCLEQLEYNGAGFGQGKKELDTETVNTIKKSNVSKLVMKNCDLTKLKAEDVCLLATNLRSLSMWHIEMTKSQLHVFFTILSHTRGLSELDIGYSYLDLTILSPDSFASALARRTSVNLGFTKLTNQQLSKLFERISKRTTIRTLDVGYRDISSVDPDILRTAVSKLSNVNICCNKLITTPYIFSNKKLN